MGLDNSMTVKLESGKIAEVSVVKARHIDYGYAVENLKGNRAERVIATGDCLTRCTFQGTSAGAELTLYTGTPTAAPEFSAAKQIASPEIAQPAKHQDIGIGF